MSDEDIPVPQDRWLYLTDPAWEPQADSDAPPFERVVGGWFTWADGRIGPFRPNPAYEPAEPGSPTDPVDALVRLCATGEGSGDHLLSCMATAAFGLALDEHGEPVVADSPDDVPCVLVTTAAVHRGHVDAGSWRDVTAKQLVAAAPEGTDVLINPGAAASMRVLTMKLRERLVEGSAPDEHTDPFVPVAVELIKPTDPLDAILRSVSEGEAGPADLQRHLREARFQVAVEQDGTPHLDTTLEGAPNLLVVSSEQHRRLLRLEHWQDAELIDLVAMLDDESGVCFNLKSPAALRVPGEYIRDAWATEH